MYYHMKTLQHKMSFASSFLDVYMYLNPLPLYIIGLICIISPELRLWWELRQPLAAVNILVKGRKLSKTKSSRYFWWKSTSLSPFVTLLRTAMKPPGFSMSQNQPHQVKKSLISGFSYEQVTEIKQRHFLKIVVR